MNLKVDSNAFTKLNGMTGISYVNIENLNNELKEKSLKGNIKISGKYLGDKIEDDNNLNSFENIIPYEIFFTQDNIKINSIEIKNFEYYEVAGRGIEASFIIDIEYDLVDTRENQEIEKLKEEITIKIDEILNEKLEIVEDNFLEEEIIDRRNTIENVTSISNKNDNNEKLLKNTINNPKYQIKVIYYKNEDIVKDLCKKHNLKYDYVLKENQKYAYNENKRIIISEQNEYHQ